MLKTVVVNTDSKRPVVILGLNENEVEQLNADKTDAAFMIHGETFGSPVDILIFHGETEASMLETISTLISPETQIIIDEGLKN